MLNQLESDRIYHIPIDLEHKRNYIWFHINRKLQKQNLISLERTSLMLSAIQTTHLGHDKIRTPHRPSTHAAYRHVATGVMQGG